MKTCTKCSIPKPFTDFHKGSNYADGYRSICKACMSAYYKQRNSQPKQKLKQREWSYRRLYNITPAEYDQLLKKQGGGCAICGDTKTRKGSDHLHVDHDHQTGEVRGILCNHCNVALGYIKDKPDLLQKAINYLNPCHVTSTKPHSL